MMRKNQKCRQKHTYFLRASAKIEVSALSDCVYFFYRDYFVFGTIAEWEIFF